MALTSASTLVRFVQCAAGSTLWLTVWLCVSPADARLTSADPSDDDLDDLDPDVCATCTAAA